VTIRAWRVHRYGEPRDALQIDDVEEQSAGPGQVVVRTSTTPLNFNEVDGCFGRYRTINPPLPYTLGMEAVGEVVRAGEGSEDWLGKRVVATAAGAFGGHAQQVLADTDMTFDAPDRLDDVQAAAFFFPSTSPTSHSSSAATCSPGRRCSSMPERGESARPRSSSAPRSVPG
jgi:NADPH:quinone reductase